MDTPTSRGERRERESWKGVRAMPIPARRALQAARDPEVERLVNRHEIISANLMAGVLGFPDTPQDVQTVAEIMARLASKEKLFQFVTQRHVHYGVSFRYSLQKRGATAQLAHKNMRTQRWTVFDQILMFDETLSDEELRTRFMKEKGALIADDFTRLATKGFLWEDERIGEHTIAELVKKSARYSAKQNDLQAIFNVTNLRVVWNLASWPQVQALLEALRQLPGTGMFLLTHSTSTFDPRHASRTLSMSLFHCPAFPEPIKLLED